MSHVQGQTQTSTHSTETIGTSKSFYLTFQIKLTLTQQKHLTYQILFNLLLHIHKTHLEVRRSQSDPIALGNLNNYKCNMTESLHCCNLIQHQGLSSQHQQIVANHRQYVRATCYETAAN